MDSKKVGIITGAELEKWGFPLPELYRLGFAFYKQNSGKAIHLSYEDNLKLIAFKQQASFGAFNAQHAPALGVLDVIGRDRQQYWQTLGNITREQAMEGFIDLLDAMCSAFRPYIEAVKQNREETLKAEIERIDKERDVHEKQEREQKKMLEEGYKEEMARRQLQDALNKQTYHQFKAYAEKQFPGNPEQQAVLIHQLQQEHYHQYMQQLHLQNQNQSQNEENTELEATVIETGSLDDASNEIFRTNASNNNSSNKVDIAKVMENLDIDDSEQVDKNQQSGDNAYNCIQSYDSEEHGNDCDDCVLIRPAKIWSRSDIEQFKAEVSSGDGDGVITVGHGDTVTVRVPTNVNGRCIFWEFATDNYDIGFGIYFEWAKPITSEVTVHVSDSDDDDDCIEDDYLSTTDDLEAGSLSNDRIALGSQTNSTTVKPPISIIVPIYRRECYNEVYVGSHAYPGEGVYLLKFDNSYSIWRSKTLYYRVYYER